jgi:hypothetical protein
MSKEELGCCGAYCRTCKVLAEGACRGCKTGYDSGERTLSRAKCRIKVCCIGRDFASCADCPDIFVCDTLGAFHGKSGYKYEKYRDAITFIREHGYDCFFSIADTWKSATGKY